VQKPVALMTYAIESLGPPACAAPRCLSRPPGPHPSWPKEATTQRRGEGRTGSATTPGQGWGRTRITDLEERGAAHAAAR
jgi:hypothetical protein